ncbi:hypothetical protein FGB62_102g022 [Gracilaria domingensis]|nr:hypothetical protein FGB62_102g022 [Gracilaria domingensis]
MYMGCACKGSITEDELKPSTLEDDGDTETANLTAVNDEAESSESVPDCVETSWLKRNGLGHGILRERGASSVLCPPNLPCATPGHLLRKCDIASSCTLQTYAQTCKEREDCVYRCTEVSRLRNSVDWSMVSSSESNGISLYLTSLSVHEHESRFPFSHGVAHLADWLNSRGLGDICDTVVLSLLRIGELKLRISEFLLERSTFGTVWMERSI